MRHAFTKSLESLNTRQWLVSLLARFGVLSLESTNPCVSHPLLFLLLIEKILRVSRYYLNDYQHLLCDTLLFSVVLILSFNKTINQAYACSDCLSPSPLLSAHTVPVIVYCARNGNENTRSSQMSSFGWNYDCVSRWKWMCVNRSHADRREEREKRRMRVINSVH